MNNKSKKCGAAYVIFMATANAYANLLRDAPLGIFKGEQALCACSPLKIPLGRAG
jgi:hypothetical protein